ncbi:MAG: HAD family hydrolase [Candidatus Eremiobacteraeota bacterium]|nr:HAD family hydrolase [Candidatus Eremiobacteraeota bacterium]
MKRAVFLDRDGVINRLVYNPSTGEHESPHDEKDFELMPGAVEALKSLEEQGFLLFLVSNQPSFAKGKASFEALHAVHEKFCRLMEAAEVHFTEYYYCYHHPEGVVPELARVCSCRKPGPLFLQQARDRYGLDLARAWMVGDRDSDVECGKACGTRTILIENPHSAAKRGKSSPDSRAASLADAAAYISAHARGDIE